MSAIDLQYNSDLVYSSLIDNVIILKDKSNDDTIYKFPIPRNFQISGIVHYYGPTRPAYIITPYKLNKPKFIPDGYSEKIELYPDGLWHTSNGKIQIAYIDTSIISEKDFEYSTVGKFKISNNEIPEPFWIPHFLDFYTGWDIPDNIPKKVAEFDKNARLINEEELISIFALNDFGMQFWEVLPEDIYEESFFKEPEKYVLCANEFGLDNWDMVAASRENRNIYRMIYREKTRMMNEFFWYRNRVLTAGNEKPSSFHIFPVLDSKSKTYKK